MCKLLSLLLLCLWTNAFGQTAVDSGRCPWKLPFTIPVHADGWLWQHWHVEPAHHIGNQTYDSNWWIGRQSRDMYFTVDTTNLNGEDSIRQISLFNDTLRIFRQTREQAESTLVLFVECIFIPHTDSIAFLNVRTERTSKQYQYYIGGWWYLSYVNSSVQELSLANLQFDDTSIYVTDSSLKAHKLQITSHTSDYHYLEPEFPQYYQLDESTFYGSSANLSGIFRPTHFSDQTSGVAVARKSQSLNIHRLNDKLECSFSSSAEARSLEVYSLIGSKMMSANIPPGATEATLPKLANGFYILRLGGETQKIRIND